MLDSSDLAGLAERYNCTMLQVRRRKQAAERGSLVAVEMGSFRTTKVAKVTKEVPNRQTCLRLVLDSDLNAAVLSVQRYVLVPGLHDC